ncbi:histidine kinase dimerization/phosphoacceptor domain -containing protein [Methanococcoides methylutens]|uniref:histidine kinase dimerization/phosphoacceptor domain -containing protein n=1 Tax=Methanococcoides methylutens TaxID=2226 RepID=UPI0006948B09|nr:histidine kinase dimerization/phosphoacceptor domain -containing protein [Methanococcoides methylutens]
MIMNGETLNYDELKARYNKLQKQVSRFSAIEQKLVNTGDLLDQELGRFKSIQSYNKKAIRSKDLHDLLLITVESIVEVFEVECGAFFTYDMANNRLTLVEDYGFDEKYPLVMDWMVSDDIVNAREAVFIEDSSPTNPWESLGLCQVIYAPYYKDGDLQGFVLGGRSIKKKEFYDKIDEELRPSFMVFTHQMSALLHNIESREIIRQNIAELTSTNNQLQQEITQRKQAEYRIKKMNECFLSFGTDPLENINYLTALFGEMMGANCAFYNRLDEGLLCSWGQWNTPTDYKPVDEPEGHLCYDVIQRAQDRLMVIRNLYETAYAHTDPNVIPYGLKTYVGTGVKLGTNCVGSLCCVFQNDFVPTKEDKWMIGVIATAIAVEEKRKWVQEELLNSENKYRMIFEHSPVGIFHYDQNGVITHSNDSFAKIIGAPAEKIIGYNILKSPENVQVSKVVRETLSKRPGHYEGEYRSVIGGKHTMIKAEANPIFSKNESSLGGICVVEDVTERKQAEEVQKKDTLLKEIHHRVKNNLQIISSLLNLQSRNFSDEKVIDAFKESQNRVRSMAIAHQKLYQSKDLASINVGDYIKNLTNYLFQTYRIGNRAAKLKLDVDNINMGIERTIPLGLIINEIVSNSLKYAYQEEQEGDINIEFHLENKMFTLIISDTGTGIPKELDYRNSHSLGLQLVTTLVKQIRGEIELDRSEGTKFVITFEE